MPTAAVNNNCLGAKAVRVGRLPGIPSQNLAFKEVEYNETRVVDIQPTAPRKS